MSQSQGTLKLVSLSSLHKGREAVILLLALKQADTAHTESKCIPTVRSEQEKGTKTAHIRINYFLTGFFPL